MMKKILLIDDDHDIHRNLKITLEQAGYELFSAYDGDSGVKQYATLKPDLVILDYLMPGKNGLDVYHDLKSTISSQKLHESPVIFLTAYAHEPRKVSAILESGANAYLQKPFGPRELLNIIENTFVTHEITLRNRRLKEVIEDGKNFLESLVESCPVAIFTTDKNGAITFLSKAAEDLLGCEVGELISSPFQSILRDEGALFADFEASGLQQKQCEVRVQTKSGRQIPLELIVSVLRNSDGHSLGYLIVGKDLSTLKQLEKEKLEKERLTAINESLATINHQINNPLTPIIGNVQLIRSEGGSLNKSQLEKLDIIESNAKKISQIIKKFNQVSELSKRKYYGDLNYLDLN